MTAHAIVYAPIGQGTRSEQVVERLSNAIVAGLLHPDEQLPNENELSRLMGVSPVTVREALNTLRARQLIDTRRGRNGGSFVCPVPAQMMHDRHPLRLATPGDLADLGELHCAVIGHSAKLAAQRSTADDHRRLAQEIDQFEAAKAAQARAQADMRCCWPRTRSRRGWPTKSLKSRRNGRRWLPRCIRTGQCTPRWWRRIAGCKRRCKRATILPAARLPWT